MSKSSDKKAVRENRYWWEKLTDWNFTGGYSRVSDLINSLSGDDVLVMVMGSDYYRTIYNDLMKCNTNAEMAIVGIKEEPGKMTPEVPPQLKNFVIPFEDYFSLQSTFDCPMVQVHPKTAEALIKHYMQKGDFDLKLTGLK